jgi:hypothetical protein
MKRPFDDRVVVVTMLICLIASAALISMRVFWHLPVPALLMMLFLGAAICGLTYRFLGGIDDAKLSTPLITIGGTAALYLALLLLVSPTLEDRFVDLETKPLQNEIETLKPKLERAEAEKKSLSDASNMKSPLNAETVMEFIRSQPPSEAFIGKIMDMVERHQPPFSNFIGNASLRISVIRMEASKTNRYLICQTSYDALFPHNAEGSGRLLLSRTINEAGEQKTTTVEYGGPIQTDVCSQNPRKLDMQISCEVAATLFDIPGISDCRGTGDILGNTVTAASLRN